MIGGDGSDTLLGADGSTLDTLIGGNTIFDDPDDDVDVAYFDRVYGTFNGMHYDHIFYDDMLYGIEIGNRIDTYL